MPELLLELGTEELPARFIDRALPALRKAAEKSLAEAALPAEAIQVAGTPRRLTLWAGGVPERQPDRVLERTGPSKQAAYKDGQPTVAATKFAESLGLSLDELEVREVTKKGKTREYLYGKRTVEGRFAYEVLSELVPAWIEAIPFQKSMRWVPGSKVRFGRPLRRIVCILAIPAGSEVVPFVWAGVESGRESEGHRFLVRKVLELNSASWEGYLEAMEEGNVIVEPARRRERIVEGLRPHLGEAGLERYRGLVDEVKNLVEWPVVDVGSFDERFLRLPDVVIEQAMTGHQRYFPIAAEGQLAARFAYVANRPHDPVVRHGNERVLAARLADALFFFELDLKTPLAERVQALDDVVFMSGLGSYERRIARVAAVARRVAELAGWLSEDEGLAARLDLAASLARADLSTEVVGEFPELQGVMGTIYAREQGQPEDVAAALRETYLPRGEGDALPETRIGMALAIADKLDTIASAWATGKRPTGSKDPFMVRRSTVGVLRILRERGLDLGYRELLEAAVAQVLSALDDDTPPEAETLVTELLAYFRDRLEVMATKDEGRRHDLTRAALDAGRDPSNVVDLWLRLEALEALAEDERFRPLCELVERTKKITRKNGPDVDPADVDRERLEHDAEKALLAAIEGCRDGVRVAMDERRYVDAGRSYVEALADVTHTFFEPAPQGVFVMHDDPRLRTNRLALLKQVHGLLAEGFADLARVVAKG